MQQLGSSGVFRLDERDLDLVSRDFVADWVDTETSLRTVGSVFDEYGYLMDPHTAVGWEVARRLGGDNPTWSSRPRIGASSRPTSTGVCADCVRTTRSIRTSCNSFRPSRSSRRVIPRRAWCATWRGARCASTIRSDRAPRRWSGPSRAGCRPRSPRAAAQRQAARLGRQNSRYS